MVGQVLQPVAVVLLAIGICHVIDRVRENRKWRLESERLGRMGDRR